MEGNRFEDLRRQLESRRLEMAEKIDNLAAEHFTGQAADGSVQVTVDGTGAVQAIWIDPTRLDTIRGGELGRSVVDAVASARSASDAAAVAASDSIVGDPAALQRLGERIGQHAKGERD